MRHACGQQKQIALADVDIHDPAILHGLEQQLALGLVEQLLARIHVVVLARVGTPDRHHDELAVAEDAPITHRGFQQVAVFLDPALEIQRTGD